MVYFFQLHRHFPQSALMVRQETCCGHNLRMWKFNWRIYFAAIPLYFKSGGLKPKTLVLEHKACSKLFLDLYQYYLVFFFPNNALSGYKNHISFQRSFSFIWWNNTKFGIKILDKCGLLSGRWWIESFLDLSQPI